MTRQDPCAQSHRTLWKYSSETYVNDPAHLKYTNCRSTIHILFQPSAFPRRTFHSGCVKNIRMLQKPYNFHLPFKNFERKFASHRGFESQCVI